jgi:hypothetical protein
LSIVDEFKKDWLSTLLMTDGILITISLMILTILYTTSLQLTRLQLIIVGSFVAIASFSFMLSTIWALDAHGALIIAISKEEKNEEAYERVRVTARRAELAFKAGILLIFVAILLLLTIPNLSLG